MPLQLLSLMSSIASQLNCSHAHTNTNAEVGPSLAALCQAAGPFLLPVMDVPLEVLCTQLHFITPHW